MARLPWFKHYPQDFYFEIFECSDAVELAVRRLRDAYWMHGGRLPNDDKSLAKHARVADCEWLAMREDVQNHFKVNGGFWKPVDLHAQMKEAEQSHNSLSAAGQKGAASRWQHKRKLNNGHANGEANDEAIDQTIAKPLAPPMTRPMARQSQIQKQSGEVEPSETLSRTRARAKRRIPNKINELGVTRGRSAPLARPQASPKTNGIALKSHRKELLRQKLYRFADATKTGEERHKAFEGLTGADPEHSEQWWLDHLDRQMRIANWNDVPK